MHTQNLLYCISQPLRGLPEVPSPEHHIITKRPATVKEVLWSTTHCFHEIPMLHRNFIPHNYISLLERLLLKAVRVVFSLKDERWIWVQQYVYLTF